MQLSEIAVVHHRTPKLLETALARLEEHAPRTPVRVIDTGNAADEVCRACEAHARTRVERVANVGYAASVNHVLKTAAGPLICVMNADVLIDAHTLPALTAPFHDPRVALSGPLARTPSGRLQDQGIPYRRYTARLEGLGPLARLWVPWLSGCIFAVRVPAAHDAGGMDASLRFYNEDLEWGLRLRGRGWRLALLGTEVEHVGGASGPIDPKFLIEGLRGGMVVAQRHKPPWRRRAQRLAVMAMAAVRARTARPERRPAWRAVVRMARRGRFDESPFGATLEEASPTFDVGPTRAAID